MKITISALILSAFVFATISCVHESNRSDDARSLSSVTPGIVPLPAACRNLSKSLGHVDRTKFEEAHLKRYLDVLKRVVKKTKVDLEFKFIDPNKLVNWEQAEKIVDKILDLKSELRQEMGRYIEDLKMGSPKFWNVYFPSYDKIVSFVSGYQEIFQMAGHVLPHEGVVADIGAGSGNASTYLSFLKHVVFKLIDFSPLGLDLALQKMELVASGRYEMIRSMVTDKYLPHNSLDGAFINNVLYTSSEPGKVLARAYAALKPGGILVLNDPNNSINGDPVALRSFMMSVIKSALDNGAEVTEYDLALVAAMNAEILLKKKFDTPEKLEERATDAHFIVLGRYTTYYGAGTLLVLQKPATAPSAAP